MALFLGIDVSTTATKALLIDERGVVVATASSEYELSTPRPLWSEQKPADWWAAAQKCIPEALKSGSAKGNDVRAVGVTGQMHGLVMLDAGGRVLRPAILWNDQRSGAECDAIRDLIGRKRLVAITGNDAFAGFTAPKILWVRNHEPEIYRRVGQILLPKDYIRYRLTGEYATDKAGAGGTLLLDLASRDWSREILNKLEIPTDWLPATHEGTEVTGQISREAAQATGLAAGTPVVGGGGDQSAQGVGVGAVRPGIVALTLGTSGVVFTTSERPLFETEGRIHAFPHAVPERWHVMGVMLSAAGSLRWYRDAIGSTDGYDTLLKSAESVEPGCNDLFFLPYLSGERTPHADSLIRSAFVGLTLNHGTAHLTRAVLEGVAFGLNDNLDLLRRVGVDRPTQIRASGGGTRSRLWKQILADVLDVEVVAVQTEEGAAFGAALLAGVGAGAWRSIDDACDQAILTSDSIRPRPAEIERYRDLHARFRRLYPILRPFYHGSD